MNLNQSLPSEPDLQTALGWWADLKSYLTPIGWKDHFFRFNVLYNGGIVAQPHLKATTAKWKGQGVQLSFSSITPAQVVSPVAVRLKTRFKRDDRSVRQGWRDEDAPVLWSEWSADGLLWRTEVFAYVPGAQAVVTGIEPLFAWVRISIHDACQALPLSKRYGFLVTINAPYLTDIQMIKENNLWLTMDTKYPRPLKPLNKKYSATAGYRLTEAGNRVRLGVAPGGDCTVDYMKYQPNYPLPMRLLPEPDRLLYIELDNRVGNHVDLLVPMLPCEKRVFDPVFKAGYQRALQQANRYWKPRPSTAARVVVPEFLINESIKHHLKMAEVIAEKNPETKHYAALSGSFKYANLWATPYSMFSVMLLDTLGYHAVAEKYLELFKKEQGTVTPPGPAFTPHPGYLSTPKSLTSVDWLTDHGAILYAIAMHGLLSGDRRFMERWLTAVLKACEFIRDARRITGHGGVEGIMPPATATDRGTKIQAVWADGWMYKGLTAAVRLLEKTDPARAAEFAAEARQYRKTFVRALRQKCYSMPAWKDKQGQAHAFVPTALSGDKPDETINAFYLDTGPLFLVFSGLLDARDELMQSSLLWFREGPQRKLSRFDSDCWLASCLNHEMSSCEPCYSWNLFHSWQLGDRVKYLEGMYSLFAGAQSRQTFTVCETRDCVTGLTPCLPGVYLARLAVVDDQLKEGELHLLRLMPRAWLKPGAESIFEKMPTEFGPVTLKMHVSRDGKTLNITFKPQFRRDEIPRKVILHVPSMPGLKKTLVNGKLFRPAGGSGEFYCRPR